MKKFISLKLFAMSLIFIVFFANNVFCQTIHFEFANAQITGTAPNQFYEFDILASATQPTQFKVAQLYISYNTAGFGNNPAIEITYALDNSELLWPVIGPLSQIGNYSASWAKNSNGILVIQNIWYKSGSGSLTGYSLSNQLTNSPKRYVHVKMAIADPNQTAGISFVNPSISKGNLQHYHFTTPGTNNKAVYPNVTYGPGLNSPLPVELNSFTVEVNKKGILLNWATETEVNNYGFDIESALVGLNKQDNEKNFTKIGFVAGSGNSNSPKKYSYLIEGVKYGKYAYRLKQIDNDGKYEYSKVIEVNAGEIPNGFVLEQNYPNPFNPKTNIRFASSENETARLVVYDVLGNEVAELFNDKLEANKVYNIEFNASNLSSGVYFYAIKTNSFNQIKKMILLK